MAIDIVSKLLERSRSVTWSTVFEELRCSKTNSQRLLVFVLEIQRAKRERERERRIEVAESTVDSNSWFEQGGKDTKRLRCTATTVVHALRSIIVPVSFYASYLTDL